jgi:hypothetical protein
MYAETNAPYPNRVQLVLGPTNNIGWGLFWGEYWGSSGSSSTTTGPFFQNGPLGLFNPSRDLQVYADGQLLPVQTWSFDSTYNRYLLYMATQFNLQGAIQLVSHMPNPPFQSVETNIIPGFALLASYSTLGDGILSASMNLAVVPSSTMPFSSVILIWSTINVAQIEITTPGSPPLFSTGKIATSGIGIYPVSEGFASTTTFTMNGYDALGNPIAGLLPVSAILTII